MAPGLGLGLLLVGCRHPDDVGRPRPSHTGGAQPTGEASAPTGETSVPLGWRMLDVGYIASCGVLTDGRLVCWGDDDRTSYVPDGPFVSVSLATDDITCGLRPDGELGCWCMKPSSSYDCGGAPSGTGFVEVQTGNFWACAEDGQHRLRCWGEPTSVRGAPTAAVLDWAIEEDFGCAVLTDHTVTCWGGTEILGQAGPEALLEPPPELSYVGVAVGRSHACALDTEGEAHCWGSTGLQEPYPEAPPGPFASLVAWSQFTCGLRPDGEAVCWYDFPLMDDVDPDKPGKQPWGPPGGKRWAQLGLGEWDGCGLTLDGEAACWAPDTDTEGEVLELPSLDDL